MAKISKSEANREREWQVNSAMNTLNDYNKLMKDGGLMRDVQKKAQEQLNMVNARLKNGGGIPSSRKAPKKSPAIKKVVAKKKK